MHVDEHQLLFLFCGTNSNYQNCVVEHDILTVSNIVRAMSLHAPVR